MEARAHQRDRAVIPRAGWTPRSPCDRCTSDACGWAVAARRRAAACYVRRVTEKRANEARANEARANDAGANDARANDARANDARANEARANEARLQAAFERIDEANAQDPNLERLDGQEVPKELLYGCRMSAMLETFAPDASPAVRLAARAQHLQRWKLPRSEFSMDRKGYLSWRQKLYGVHAELAGSILAEVGFDAVTVARVGTLLRKKGLKTDPEAQLLEDVICLVFLRHYFAGFAAKHDEAKVVDILRKTWSKMSERGREAALALPLGEERRLVERALAGD